MAISKSVAWLNEQLEMGNDRLLLMDCRPQELYESSHIESAINVAIPGIMLRRLQKGNLPLRSLVSSSEEDRERFARRCGTDTVVLYDEHSRDWNENTGGESVLGLLLKRLKDEGCKAFYLEGEKGRPGLGGEIAACLPGGPGLVGVGEASTAVRRCGSLLRERRGFVRNVPQALHVEGPGGHQPEKPLALSLPSIPVLALFKETSRAGVAVAAWGGQG